jgi:putative membrane protein
MRTLFLALLIASGIMIIRACNDAGQPTSGSGDSTAAGNTGAGIKSEDTSSAANSAGNSNSSTASSAPLSKDDSTFIVKAADGGMAEVELGQVAQQNAANDRVKSFGNMMVNDHSGANNELKQIASRKNFNLPSTMSDKHMEHKNDLSKKKGKDFDKAYIKMMVNDHEEDIKEFEKASTNAQDPDIKAFATKTLPTLRMHLDSAKAIRKMQ